MKFIESSKRGKKLMLNGYYVHEESREEKCNTLWVFAKNRIWLGLLSKKSIHIQLQVEPCADDCLSAAARRVVLTGGGGAPVDFSGGGVS